MDQHSGSSEKSVVITGVSKGIGLGLATKFLENGIQVFGSVRNAADATTLKASFPELFTPLIFDVTDEQAVTESVGIVEKKLNGNGLDALINNAGMAEGGPLLYMDMELIRRHFEVNVFGVIRVIKAFAPLLGAVENYGNQPGKIINISSTSGRVTSPFIAPYVGTKHALEGISGSLRKELMKFGIDVILVRPGVVKTPIWEGTEDLKGYESPYKDSLNKFKKMIFEEVEKGLEPKDVAKKVFAVFNSKKPKTKYLVAPSKLNDWTLPLMMPERTLDSTFAKLLELNPRN